MDANFEEIRVQSNSADSCAAQAQIAHLMRPDNRLMALQLALQHTAGQACTDDVIDTAKAFEGFLSGR